MKSFSNLGQLCLSLVFCLGLQSCNSDDFYEKVDLIDPGKIPTATGSVDEGSQGGSTSGSDTTQGGVDGGATGGTNGSTTGGTSSGGTTTGSTTGGTTTGSTTGGTTTGSTTGGTTTGSTTGGTTTGSTTGGTTTGSTTGGTTSGSTTGGTTTGSTTGGSANDVTENFSQSAEETKKLDIVWIVDDSRSMEDEQSSLANNFSNFIDEFIQKNVDFKMAITTTDTSTTTRAGKIVTGSDTLLTSAKASTNVTKFKNDFKSLIQVGIVGDGYEKGLAASEAFMQKNAASFLREDAYLAVVIVSDEADQSSKTPKQYVDFLKSFKREAGLVKVYTIVDQSVPRGSASENTTVNGMTLGFDRYAKASEESAGVIGDIRQNFSSVLGDMGESIINLLDSFALANTPIPGTLNVYVNNVQVTNYSFDSSSRSIKFDAGHLPPVGAAVRVTYKK
jgi:hypothetical protein